MVPIGQLKRATSSVSGSVNRNKMAPLDLDRYIDIGRQCKYLPENDLKVWFLLSAVTEHRGHALALGVTDGKTVSADC